ncbi:MAG TPA: type I-E CRISPR-associated protein Cas6/Cse3/CasE [Verrucomicrobiales bacterium]|nr:type I-E CRISPR-associated protein Cas6/Cse3/CasE [Verrucomicrobiales bacterium]
MSTAISDRDKAKATLHLTQILVFYEDAVRLLRIRDTYDWHQRVWQAFGGREGAERDFLIRVDRKEEAYRVLILSLSPPAKPDWCPTDCFSSKVIPESFFCHERYRFSLLANPTRKVRVENADGSRKKNGRRMPLTQRDDLVAWLGRKAETGGFHIERNSLRTIPRGREFFHKDAHVHGMHAAVEFQGELTVTDAGQFRGTVVRGIGSAKAFGFGLLVLAPLD